MGNGKTDRPRDKDTDGKTDKMTWREIKIKEQRDENIKRHTNTERQKE